MYPNLVRDNLFVNVEDGNYEVYIYNYLGKQIFKEHFTTINSFNLNDLKKGVYLLNIIDVETNKTYPKKNYKRVILHSIKKDG
ncbi:T9SS type A sorting domain-containing protein [Polaribacter marinivivus]|uniref:T9SS type A sorting domain-containing protein n=1 Tax=Polaribacter marinivivus TaxID=1524260 RepID=UPI003D34A76D